MKSPFHLLFALFMLLASPMTALAQMGAGGNSFSVTAPGSILPGDAAAWRIQIMEAAIVNDSIVRLGDIGKPLGNVSAQEWQRMAAYPLWAAPDTQGRPMQIQRQRLLTALREAIGDLADSCLLPSSLSIQLGGSVIMEDDLRSLVIRTLTPQINMLGGFSELTDFRLPSYTFMSYSGQSLILEPITVAPGRINLKFAVQEMDGSIVRRFTGSVFLDLWLDVPCLTRPLARGEAVTLEVLTFVSTNLAYQRGAIWDGRGGPWQTTRSLPAMMPILASDLGPLAAIHRGDLVTLIFESGNLRLSIQVEALGEGSPGDTIIVRNLDSRKQVYATVIDSNTVRTR